MLPLGTTNTHHNIRPDTVIHEIKRWIKRYGPPETILSDQGRQYTATEYQSELSKQGVKRILCSAYSPTSNGMAERINQIITFVLKHFKRLPITKAVTLAETRLRHCYHRGIGCTPSELAFGKHPFRLSKDPPRPCLQHALEQAAHVSDTNRAHENSKRNRNHHFEIDDLVYRRCRDTGKLAPTWEGPYKITEINLDKQFGILRNEQRIARTNLRQIRPL